MRKADFFEGLCEDYYEKILRYLFSVLKNETAARDCTQEVFLVALQKETLLMQHPNVGGFLFQTAKNLTKKHYRKHFTKMMTEYSMDDDYKGISDSTSETETVLDNQIDEREYIDTILEQLIPEKRTLYTRYYIENIPMAEIAIIMGVKEPALRMRFVRLRREMIVLIKELSEKEFSI